MKLKVSSLLICGLLFAAIAIPAHANNEAMMTLFKVLYNNGDITEENYQLLINAAKIDQQKFDILSEKLSAVEEKVAINNKKSASVSLKGGHLKIKSADNSASIKIGGRIMADYAFMDDNDLGNTGNASEFRRARLFVAGSVSNDFAYKLNVDFAGNGTTIKDAYIKYNGWKPVSFTLGHHNVPFSLNTFTSSKYITFIERSAATEAFTINRKNGLSALSHGSNWSLKAMVHLEGIDNENDGQDEDYGYGLRATFAPLLRKNKVLHFGVAAHHQELEASGGSAKQIALRPEVHTAKAIFKSHEDIFKDYNTFGVETAITSGPFSVQAEYFYRNYNSASGIKDQSLNSWYVYGSYFLTGESRPYSASSGAFGRIKPKSVVGQGGHGAWEIGLRYTDIDLDDHGFGDKGDITTIGVNWYATPTIRFMANYTLANVDGQHDDFDAVHFRSQIDF
ncbi:MAG: hypothetical protein HRT92_00300 [Piscirickettsiaceae bacterium]|nr:hypothetical protein [Piscirickettsiaceae bacterium]